MLGETDITEELSPKVINYNDTQLLCVGDRQGRPRDNQTPIAKVDLVETGVSYIDLSLDTEYDSRGFKNISHPSRLGWKINDDSIPESSSSIANNPSNKRRNDICRGREERNRNSTDFDLCSLIDLTGDRTVNLNCISNSHNYNGPQMEGEKMKFIDSNQIANYVDLDSDDDDNSSSEHMNARCDDYVDTDYHNINSRSGHHIYVSDDYVDAGDHDNTSSIGIPAKKTSRQLKQGITLQEQNERLQKLFVKASSVPNGPSRSENSLMARLSEYGITPYAFEIPIGNGVCDCIDVRGIKKRQLELKNRRSVASNNRCRRGNKALQYEENTSSRRSAITKINKKSLGCIGNGIGKISDFSSNDDFIALE
eukprot:Awhi_evm2s15434